MNNLSSFQPKVESRIDFKKWIGTILVMLIVSMYFFPFTFSALPSQNTKNLMAGLGLIFILMTYVYKRDFTIPLGLLTIFLISGCVSIISLISITYNQTPDISYVTFIRSTAIWISSSFVVAFFIWLIHRRIDVELIIHYLVAVCVFQCAAAMLIAYIPAVKFFVDAHVQQGQAILDELGRLYGIGASLDVAGCRFAVVLVCMAVLIDKNKENWSRSSLVLYILAFVIITVIGNMIARTTLVGAVLALVFLLVKFVHSILLQESHKSGRMIGMWLSVLAITVPLGIILFQSSELFNDMIRFGFEGFFSFFESGEFETDSTEKLKSMIVWPEEIRTWIIGDGYFENSRNDINYLGDATDRGFYMGTDIGYLRFIFYFGLIGLLTISSLVVYSAYICANNNPEYRTLFILAAAINFIIWMKVASDILSFFYLFICATSIQQVFMVEEEEEEEELEE